MEPFIKSTNNWLVQLLSKASSENWCLKCFCTTCGAHRFREALFEFSTLHQRAEHTSWHFALIDALKNLNGPVPINQKLFNEYEGLRLIFVLLDNIYHKDLDTYVHGTWAGNFLSQMRKHYQQRD